MPDNETYMLLAEKVRAVFQESLGHFHAGDFIPVADLVGFHAVEKQKSEAALKPLGENYLPDIIGTNLSHAVEAYCWNTHVPMTEDGFIVSGFWDREKAGEVPTGYELEAGGRFLRKI